MILTDTGPLVALINRNDPNHAACVRASKNLPAESLLTTWPCFTESMYLLFQGGGYPAQDALWRLWTGGRIALHDLTKDEINRMVVLMGKYRDKPMDLADASLIVAAESLKMQRVFTLDSDFQVYRMADGSALELIL